MGDTAIEKVGLDGTKLAVTRLSFGTSGLGDMPDTYGYGVDTERAQATVRAIFDGPVNRITQHANEIVLQYGQLGFTRTIHMNETSHPTTIRPSLGGHSIGRWDGDVLVVDTAGFRPGMMAPPVPSSDKLHVVERFALDSKTMLLTRSYTADDPVYLKGSYAGSDVVQVADIPYRPDQCHELGRLDYSKEGERGVKAAMQKH